MTTQTANELRESAARHDQDAADSFERCDTDGFVSQWASGINARVDRENAAIADAGGVATFARYELRDLDDEPVAAKLINGKFGKCWALLDSDGEFTGTFVGAHPARPSTLERKGYREGEVEFVAEAKARTWAPSGARGMSGAASVQVIVSPTDPNLKADRCIGVGDLTG